MNGPLLSKGGQVYYGELGKNETFFCSAEHRECPKTWKIQQDDPTVKIFNFCKDCEVFSTSLTGIEWLVHVFDLNLTTQILIFPC